MRRSLDIISGAFALRNQVFARVNGVAAREKPGLGKTNRSGAAEGALESREGRK
jgi:hypothetical protein